MAEADLAERLRSHFSDVQMALGEVTVIVAPDEIASSLEPVIRITCSSFGQRSRTRRILSACSSSSTTTALASEFSSTYWHSSGEFVW